MFTGIVESVGRVAAIAPRRRARAHRDRRAARSRAACASGDSVAVNGGCLTVTRIEAGRFHFEAVRETLERTALGDLRSARASTSSARCAPTRASTATSCRGTSTAPVACARSSAAATTCGCAVDCGPKLARVPGGEGLGRDRRRLADRGRRWTTRGFDVALIPHTLAVTTLGERRAGRPREPRGRRARRSTCAATSSARFRARGARTDRADRRRARAARAAGAARAALGFERASARHRRHLVAPGDGRALRGRRPVAERGSAAPHHGAPPARAARVALPGGPARAAKRGGLPGAARAPRSRRGRDPRRRLRALPARGGRRGVRGVRDRRLRVPLVVPAGPAAAGSGLDRGRAGALRPGARAGSLRRAARGRGAAAAARLGATRTRVFLVGLALLLAAAAGALCEAGLARASRPPGARARRAAARGCVRRAAGRRRARHAREPARRRAAPDLRDGVLGRLDLEDPRRFPALESLRADPRPDRVHAVLVGAGRPATRRGAGRVRPGRSRASRGVATRRRWPRSTASISRSPLRPSSPVWLAVRFHWLAFLPLLYLLAALEARERPLASRPLGFAAATALLAVAMPRANGFGDFFAEVGREPHGWRGGFMDERYCGPGMRFLADARSRGPPLPALQRGRLPRLLPGAAPAHLHRRAPRPRPRRGAGRLPGDPPREPRRPERDSCATASTAGAIDVFFADAFSGADVPGSRLGLPAAAHARVADDLRVAQLRDLPAAQPRQSREPGARGRLLSPARRALRSGRATSTPRARCARRPSGRASSASRSPTRRASRPGAAATTRRCVGRPARSSPTTPGGSATSPAALALDEEALAEEPDAFDPAWRRVDALLALGRPRAALEAAQALAARAPRAHRVAALARARGAGRGERAGRPVVALSPPRRAGPEPRPRAPGRRRGPSRPGVR